MDFASIMKMNSFSHRLANVTPAPPLKMITKVFSLCLLLAILSGCGGEPTPPPLETAALPTFEQTALPSPMPALTPAGLFIEMESAQVITPAPFVIRSRIVKVNRALLLDERGELRILDPNTEITLNLFPDVTYIGVIEHVQQDGDDYSWIGHLKEVEFSQLTILFSAEVFIAHVASPAGVYEVSSVGDDLYQISLIDQTKLQGGEG
jgi:hypothetical protein